MSTATLSNPLTSAEQLSLAPAATQARWPLWLAALVVGGAFFVTENDTTISLADSFTQTAEEMQAETAGGNPLRRFAFFAVAGLGAMLLFRARERKWNVNILLAAAMLAYVLWCGVSLLWSINPGMCIRRLIILGCTFIGALGISRQFTMRELSKLALIVTGAVVGIGVLAEIRLGTFRPWSGDYRFSGSVHPNTQGMYLAVLALSAWGLARSATKGAWFCWLVLAAAIVLLVLTKSRTSLAALLVCMGAVLTLQTSLKLKVMAGVFGGWLLGAAFLALLLSGVDPKTDLRDAALLGRAEESESFSGRLSIWPEVLYSIRLRPWTGYGHESYWTSENIDIIFEAIGWGVREAHNGYLEVLLSTGIIGLVFLLAAVLLSLANMARSYLGERDLTYGLPFGMLLFGLFNTSMESGMVYINLGTFLIACCVMRIAFFANPAPRRTEQVSMRTVYRSSCAHLGAST